MENHEPIAEPPLASPYSAEPLPSLTGLRLVAAGCVLVAHSSSIVSPIWAANYQALGWHLVFLGMTLFFVLSGFVITYNYLESFRIRPLREALSAFLTARMARLLPLYLFFFLATLATLSFHARWHSQRHLLPLYLTQTQSWFFFCGPDLTQSFFKYFAGVWSIGTEWFFYLCFPAVAFALQRIRTPRNVLIGAVACVATGTAVVLLHAHDYDCHFNRLYLIERGPLPDTIKLDFVAAHAAYIHPLFRVFEFVLGCFAGRFFLLTRQVPVTRREEFVAHGGLLLGVILTGSLEMFMGSSNPLTLAMQGTPRAEIPSLLWLRMNILHAPFLACLILYSVRYVSPLSWFLNLKPIVAGGEASYSIYLLHPWLLLPFHFFPEPGPRTSAAAALAESVFRCVILFLFVGILARGLYGHIEIPGKHWVKQIARRLDSSIVLILMMYVVPIVGIILALLLYYRQI